MAKHNENPQDPATIQDRNACYSDRYGTLEAAGGAPLTQQFRGGFIGLIWDARSERMVPSVSVNGATHAVAPPGRWW